MRDEAIVDAFAGKQIANIEQIARVLAVERRNNLARVQIGKRDNLDFSEPECIFDGRHYAAQFGIKNAAPQDGSDFDFDLNALSTDKELRDRPFESAFSDLRTGNTSPDAICDAFHRGIDRHKRFRARLYRQISKIDIGRQARHVANKKIYSSPTLEYKKLFFRDERQGAKEKRNLSAVDFTERHSDPPVR
jgi:hypothetical protein